MRGAVTAAVVILRRATRLVCSACNMEFDLRTADSTIRSHVSRTHGARAKLRRSGRLPRDAAAIRTANRFCKRRCRIRLRAVRQAPVLDVDRAPRVQCCGATLNRSSSTKRRCQRRKVAEAGWRCAAHPVLTWSDARARGVHGAPASVRTVHVAKSRIHKRGLFADVHFRVGDVITQLAPCDTELARDADYRLKLRGVPMFWAAAKPRPGRGIAAFANSPHGSGCAANARWHVGPCKTAFLRASRDILPGQEVLVSYGTGFRFFRKG